MKYKIFWLVLALLFQTTLARAGRVRTLYLNDRGMQPIYLSMGRSTILRFDEKPKNAVIGNQNYFNIEFIGNDITIQPQGHVSTNLFVYTEFQTYGLILKFGSDAEYDDLVFIRWKPGYISLSDKNERPIHLMKEFSFRKSAFLKNLVKFSVTKVIKNSAQDIAICELELENISKEAILTSKIDLQASMLGKKLETQRVVFKDDAVASNSKTQGRIILKTSRKDDLSILLSIWGNKTKLIIPRKYL